MANELSLKSQVPVPATIGSQGDVILRDVRTTSEFRAVEDLQREVWGIPDLDVVPLAHLVAVQTAGGVLIGAFDREALVGFVYGFPSIEDGELAHHSHMLAVRADHRGAHIGERLKLAQRERVLEQGITMISWTFDPLRSKNAYLNFRKLGVTCNHYLFDFYGHDASSFLHRNGTDRFWVKWRLDSPRVTDRIARTSAVPDLGNEQPCLAMGDGERPILEMPQRCGETALIEIPSDIGAIESSNVHLATEWRKAARSAFSSAIDQGLAVVDFVRGKGKGTYILMRQFDD